MRLLLVVCALAAAFPAGANVSRTRPEVPATLWAAAPNGAMSSVALGCRKLRTRGFIFEAVNLGVYVAGGGGAGNTVITITDGTNTCTATFACSTTNATGGKEVVVANGAGTGCAYAVGADVCASVTTAGCTSTQPAVRNVEFSGYWR